METLNHIKGGYLMFYILLIGMLSISNVSTNNNLEWATDVIKLSPGPALFVASSREFVRDCGNVSIDDCMKKLQTFLRLKSLPFPTDEHKLNKLCSDTVGGYNCSTIKMLGPNCLSTEDRDTLPEFVEMAQYTMFMFCSSEDGEHGYLREDLLQYSECIGKQKESLDCCAEGSKLMDLPVMYLLDKSSRSLAERQTAACCPVANYLKCVQTIIAEKCGEVAGNVTAEYIRRSSGEQMESVCQKLPGYPEPDEEFCKTPTPLCSGCRTEIFIELIVFIFLLFSVFMNPM